VADVTSPDAARRTREREARRAFVAAALKDPGMVAAVLPSSGQLAEALAAVVPTTVAPIVAELGPGTGVVSGRILDRLSAGGRHLAVDLNPSMVAYLRRVHPELDVVEGDARHLVEILQERGIDHLDAVVSGLPWAVFPDSLQHDILTAVCEALTPEGAFTTFAYLHGLPLAAARRFRARLEAMFAETTISRPVWRNVPPAVVYVCRTPR